MQTQDPDHEKFDALIIGAGQAAAPLARVLGQAGWKTAVVERKHVGGSCINFGCTPTKAMAASARVAYLARRADDYGVRTGKVAVDLASVVQRTQAIVDRFRDGMRQSLESAAKVELIFGHAAFEGPHAIAVQLNAGGGRQPPPRCRSHLHQQRDAGGDPADCGPRSAAVSGRLVDPAAGAAA
jgi:pyruvate/2-oxoglutarate dehydrogenase complex dihydrolipoamide dehydrogenase (E3) component